MILDDKIEKIRGDFPYLDEKEMGRKIIYFDNAATTQKPIQVIDAEANYYKYHNANPHRGAHYLTVKATDAYENARDKVAKFINAKKSNEIIFNRNASEGLNTVAYSYALNNLKKGDEIIVSILEHHSNLVTWQFVAEKTGAKLNIVHLNDDFGPDMKEYESYLNKNTKLVALTGASNVTSYIPDVKKMIAMAKEKGAVTVLDAAQLIPHKRVDVQELDCDFLVFSGHKMIAPMGIGVLYGKEELLNNMTPFLYGGEMIEYVYEDHSTFAKAPARFEAGTVNVGGAVGLKAAIEYMEKIGLDSIFEREEAIADYAYENMKEMDFVEMYYPRDKNHRGSNISFNIKNVHPHDAASILDSFGIAVRSGHHCAMPLHKCLKLNSSCRASFAFYNTKEEIDYFIEKLPKVLEVFS